MAKLTIVVETDAPIEPADWEAFGDALKYVVMNTAQQGALFAGTSASGERREGYTPKITVALSLEPSIQVTRQERMHLWDALDRVLAGQPIQDITQSSLTWIRDRIAKQCYAEVADLDLSGDRTEALRGGK